MLFMAHTINVPLYDLHTLLRAYSAIISDTAGWDRPCQVTSHRVEELLLQVCDLLLKNELVDLPPSKHHMRMMQGAH